MMPSLESLLTCAASLHGVGPADMRLGFDERAMAAIGLFGWMAREATEAPPEAIGLYAGRSLAVMQSELTRCEHRLTADAGYRQIAHEALFGAAALDEVARRQGRTQPALPLDTVAERLLRGRAEAITVSTQDLRRLAAAWRAVSREQLELLAEVERLQQALQAAGRHAAVVTPPKTASAVAAAWRELEAMTGSPFERASRQRLNAAVAALADEMSPLKSQSSKRKEPA